MKPIQPILMTLDDTLHDVLLRLNEVKRGAVLIVDEQKHLLNIITDGDARRAVLSGVDLVVSVGKIIATKKAQHQPITADSGVSTDDLLELFQETGVSHIPLLGAGGEVVGMAELSDLLSEVHLPLQAVVMAGGQGSRLKPLTQHLPKPMLPVGDRPLMERIVQQLGQIGIRRVHITTHYLADKIKDHFGDGKEFGVDLEYVTEESQLGTAGGLALLPTPDSPLLVINGDILTHLDFRSMHNFHREHSADLTVAVRQYEVQIPYGVVEEEGGYIRQIIEKPIKKYFVNAGIYLLEPVVHKQIPLDTHFNMTDLIQMLLDEGKTVVGFPVWEYWRDIGQHADYEQAVDDARKGVF